MERYQFENIIRECKEYSTIDIDTDWRKEILFQYVKDSQAESFRNILKKINSCKIKPNLNDILNEINSPQ